MRCGSHISSASSAESALLYCVCSSSGQFADISGAAVCRALRGRHDSSARIRGRTHRNGSRMSQAGVEQLVEAMNGQSDRTRAHCTAHYTTLHCTALHYTSQQSGAEQQHSRPASTQLPRCSDGRYVGSFTCTHQPATSAKWAVRNHIALANNQPTLQQSAALSTALTSSLTRTQ